ncbi:MAG: FAD-binding protein, partial [Bacteroidales bacterium]|nr:FAD-binding protein [Bacteroidales bacterium]
PSCTEQGELVVNGMSNSKRNGRYANSGLVVQIELSDLDDYQRFGVFSAMEFQRETEQRFFDSKTRTLVAPAQRMVDFANGRLSPKVGNSTYAPGVVSAPVHELLPAFIADRMRKAFPLFGKKMHGFFTNEAQLVGLESRTSSAVRVTRDPMTYEAVNMKRLYPCGEGAGYSGGIVSSAIDGVNVADAIARIYE